MKGFRVADLDLHTRSPRVDLPARMPRIEEVWFRLKVPRRPDLPSQLVVYKFGVKWMIMQCGGGADVIASAAHVFLAVERGVQPFSLPRPGLTFVLRFDDRCIPGMRPANGLRPVDFSRWTTHFWSEVNKHWSVPANSLSDATADVDLEFTVDTNGSISELRLLKSSGVVDIDRAAQHALATSEFIDLPRDYRLPSATMQVTLSYTGPYPEYGAAQQGDEADER